jgi:hypothetical protein
MTENTIEPTNMYAIKAPTGPAMATAVPLPINKPVPIVPPKYNRQSASDQPVFQPAMTQM